MDASSSTVASDSDSRTLESSTMFEMNSSIYTHEDLETPDSIRLLILHPGEPTSDLCCSIIHTTLDGKHINIYDSAYTALSYVWGDAKKTKNIFIDGYQFPITVNLAAALDDLRDETHTLRLWVDSVCINQSNNPERSQQVTIMGHIYRNARQTIVYLGKSTTQIDQLFKDIQENDLRRKPLKQFSTYVSDILSRTWFTRVWVYQELIISTDVLVQIGRMRVLWQSFCEFFLRDIDHFPSSYISVGQSRALSSNSSLSSQLGSLGAVTHISTTTTNFVPEIAGTYSLRMLKRMNEARIKYQHSLKQGGSELTLLNILISRRGSGVSDARDMIYGHLVVASPCFTFLEEFAPLKTIQMSKTPRDYIPVIDYTKSVSRVFIDAARYVAFSIDPSRLWEILYHSEVKNPTLKTKDLPTWVPDWTLSTASLPDPPWLVDQNAVDIPLSNDFKNDRTWDDAVRKATRLHHSQHRYHFRGLVGPLFIPYIQQILSFFYTNTCLDTVDHLSNASFEKYSNEWRDSKQNILKIWNEICGIHGSRQSIIEVQDYIYIYRSIYSSWQTLGVNGIFLPPKSLSETSIYWEKFVNSIQSIIEHYNESEPIEKKIWDLPEVKDCLFNIPLIVSLYESADHIPKNRIFARFRSGVIGIVPSATEKGDAMLRFNAELSETCGILRHRSGHRDVEFDRGIMSRVTVDVNDVGPVFHCTFVGSGFVERTQTWDTGFTFGLDSGIVAIH